MIDIGEMHHLATGPHLAFAASMSSRERRIWIPEADLVGWRLPPDGGKRRTPCEPEGLTLVGAIGNRAAIARNLIAAR